MNNDTTMHTTTHTPPTTDPAIGSVWIGDLSAYNAGRLRGRWVDVEDADAIADAYREMTHDGTSDFYIADTDLVDWASAIASRWGEYAPETVWGTIRDIGEELEDYEADAFAAWAHSDIYRDWDAGVVEAFRDQYRGEYRSTEDYVYEMCEDQVGELPGWVASYVDWRAMASDWVMGGDIWTADSADGGVHVFWNY